MARSILFVGLLFAHFTNAYDLVKTYSGSTFFDDWNYIYDWDHWTGNSHSLSFRPKSLTSSPRWRCSIPEHNWGGEPHQYKRSWKRYHQSRLVDGY